jgi:predicted permease
MDSLILFQKIAVLFALMFAGYLVRKGGLLNERSTRLLTTFLVNVALPALIIVSMQIPFSNELLRSGGGMFLLAMVIYGISFVIAWYIPKLIGCPESEQGVFQFVLMFSNVGFMGFPVIETIFGRGALFYTSIYNLPFNLLVFTIGVLLLRQDRGTDLRGSLRLCLNPGLFAVIAGIALFLLSIQIPPAVGAGLDLLAWCTTPLSMIVVGSLLAKLTPSCLFSNWRIYAISSVRLLLLPLITWLVLRPFITDPVMLGIPVIIAAMPAAANTALLAEEYQANAELASQGVFITTLFCSVTIPVMALLVA